MHITLDEAIRIALDGDAILFVGAGVGYLIDGPNGKLPDGPTLSNRMLGRPDQAIAPHGLDKAVGHVLRSGGGSEVVFDKLVKNLSVVEVDDGLRNLFSMPWRRIYTTNYDDAISISRKGLRKTNICTLEDSVDKASIGTVVHINGSLKRVSPASIERDLALSDRSYATRNFENSPWHSIFVRDIETARAVIFVGYSLYDLDISRTVFSSNIADKTFFFVSPGVDEVEKGSIELFGAVPDGGAGALINLVDHISTDYQPKGTFSGFVNLRELKGLDFEADTPARILDKQLVFGILPEQSVLAGETAFHNQPFLIERRQEREISEHIRQGILRDVTIVGELASGKSASALLFCARYLQQGYRVFVAEKGVLLAEELSRLAELDDRVVVVFEGYASMRGEIRAFAEKRNVKHRIILTEQAVHHDALGDFIYEPMFAGQMGLVYLDRIHSDDAQSFAELVNFGGYWGERSGAGIDAQTRYINTNLDGSLYKLLLEIIESKEIQIRIQGLLEPVFNNVTATRLFVASCIANVVGVEFHVSDWPSLIDPAQARRSLNQFRSELSYFVAMRADRVFPRNGLLSSSVLGRIPDRATVLKVATDMFSIAARLRTPRDLFDSVHVQMMRFNVIEPILQGENAKSLILKYYDNIRPIADTRNLSDYWLQLGIAATVLDDLSTAKDAFTNAYSRERRKTRPNTKKIDNYFSRYQLKAAAAADSAEEAFDLFVKGTTGISKQIFLDDNRHYPFKSGRSYGEIAAKHFGKWSEIQRKIFVSATDEIRSRATEWRRKNGHHNPDVDYLIRETGDLLRRIEEGF